MADTTGLVAAGAWLVSGAAWANPAEVEAVVAAVKAAHPDLKALCQQGPEGVRIATMAALMPMVGQGQIKGNPQTVGTEAGMKLGQACRGG